MMSEAGYRRLNLYLASSVVSGVTIDHLTPLHFRVSVRASNITQCRLEVRSDSDTFSDSSQDIDVFFSDPTGEQQVDITLTPLKGTIAPVWIGVTAKANSIAQACGFFARIL